MSDVAFDVQQGMIKAGLDPLNANHAMVYVKANYWRYTCKGAEYLEGKLLEEIARFQIHLESL